VVTRVGGQRGGSYGGGKNFENLVFPKKKCFLFEPQDSKANQMSALVVCSGHLSGDPVTSTVGQI